MYAEIKARVHKESVQGTILQVLVPGQSLTDNLAKYSDGGVLVGELRIDDGRHIRTDQRKKAFATLRDISNWNGDDIDVNHWWLKSAYIAQVGSRMFSMSDCSVTTARCYITFLLDFCMEWDLA